MMWWHRLRGHKFTWTARPDRPYGSDWLVQCSCQKKWWLIPPPSGEAYE